MKKTVYIYLIFIFLIAGCVSPSPKEVGESCGSDRDCFTENCLQGICARSVEGGICSSHEHCEDGLKCKNSACFREHDLCALTKEYNDFIFFGGIVSVLFFVFLLFNGVKLGNIGASKFKGHGLEIPIILIPLLFILLLGFNYFMCVI